MEWKHLNNTLLEKENMESIKDALKDIGKEVKTLNEVLKNKKYIVSSKLIILEIENNDSYIQFIFNNGEIKRIAKDTFYRLDIGMIENIDIIDGDLCNHLTGTQYTAEEIYHKLKGIR